MSKIIVLTMIPIFLFGKLIRDRIPEILEAAKVPFEIHVMNDEEYHMALRLKFKEEVEEYLDAKDQEHQVEELADVLEVMLALLEEQGLTMDDLEESRLSKKEARGSFAQKLFLQKVGG